MGRPTGVEKIMNSDKSYQNLICHIDMSYDSVILTEFQSIWLLVIIYWKVNIKQLIFVTTFLLPVSHNERVTHHTGHKMEKQSYQRFFSVRSLKIELNKKPKTPLWIYLIWKNRIGFSVCHSFSSKEKGTNLKYWLSIKKMKVLCQNTNKQSIQTGTKMLEYSVIINR